MSKADGAQRTAAGAATENSESGSNADVRRYWDQGACGTYGCSWFPLWVRRFFPDRWGWFIVVRARN